MATFVFISYIYSHSQPRNFSVYCTPPRETPQEKIWLGKPQEVSASLLWARSFSFRTTCAAWQVEKWSLEYFHCSWIFHVNKFWLFYWKCVAYWKLVWQRFAPCSLKEKTLEDKIIWLKTCRYKKLPLTKKFNILIS